MKLQRRYALPMTKGGIILLLLVACSAAVACGTQSRGNADTSGTTLQSEPESAETGPNHYEATAPKKDFGGAAFRVATGDPDAFVILHGFDRETDSADTVESALYHRNLDIEETYHISFEQTLYADWQQFAGVLQMAAMSDTDDFDLVMMINREAFKAAIAGYIMPYENIPYIDTSNPWYMHKVNEMLTIGGEVFVAYTEECLNAYLQTGCVYFNKQLIADLDLADPYALVREGKWTQEALYSMAEEAIHDVNGDLEYRWQDGDRFGISAEGDTFYPSGWVGAGIYTIEKDKDDIPVYTAAGNEILVDVIARMSEYVDKDGAFLDGYAVGMGQNGVDARTESTQYFAAGNALFRYGGVADTEILREMKADFGILPTPKYDASQTAYHARMIDGWLHVPPASVRNTELLGTVMEALGAESMNYIRPAYFDVALGGKLTRDRDSEEMLNLIFDNITLDLGDTAWAGTVRGPMCNQIKSGNMASFLASIEGIVNQLISDTLEAFENRG